MSVTTLQAGMLGCALSAAIAGGATFAFSNFIMRAFDGMPHAEAVRAMQAINVTAINPLFMVVLIGTGVGALALTAASLLAGGRNPWLVGGTLVYLLGVVLVTVAGNVPLNEALAKVTPDTLEATTWTAYTAPWTAYNHLRTVAAVVASLALTLAAMR